MSQAPSSITEADVMAAILASIRPGGRLRAKSADWHSAWKEIAGSPAGERLLPGLRFEDRSPYAPFSDEVEAFERRLSRAGVLSLGNPRFRRFTIDETSKRNILGANQALIAEHGNEIRAMAELLW